MNKMCNLIVMLLSLLFTVEISYPAALIALFAPFMLTPLAFPAPAIGIYISENVRIQINTFDFEEKTHHSDTVFRSVVPSYIY